MVLDGPKIHDPAWTGADGETAISVPRADPARSDLEMERLVADQARRYLTDYTADRAVSDVALALMVQLIAKDFITPPGFVRVTLTREHLLAYVQVARKRLGELEAHHGA